MTITTALALPQPWLDLLLAGDAVWHLRPEPTHRRGRIAVYDTATGAVVGMVTLTGTGSHLDLDELRATFRLHRVPPEEAGNSRVPWHMRAAQRLPEPVPCPALPDADGFVALDPVTRDRLAELTW